MKRLVYAEDVKEQIDEWLDCVGTAYVGKGLSYYGELLGCIEDAPTIGITLPLVQFEPQQNPKWFYMNEKDFEKLCDLPCWEMKHALLQALNKFKEET